MIHGGLSERHALRVIGMSASAYRYQPAPDRNLALRAQIVALAQRHRRYGSGMIYLKLRQSGMVVNHKRVERLYAQENRKRPSSTVVRVVDDGDSRSYRMGSTRAVDGSDGATFHGSSSSIRLAGWSAMRSST